MNFADILATLRRRWYIVVAVILAAGGAAFYAWVTVPAAYERSATQLLLPGEAAMPEGANPYLYVGGLYQIADILVRAVGPEELQPVLEENPGAVVEVGRDAVAGAVLTLSVTAPTDSAAADALDDMLLVTGRTLEALQDEQQIPEGERISIMPLTQATQSVIVEKTRLLYTGVAGAVVAALGLVTIVLVDQIGRSHWRARRLERTAPESSDDVGDDLGDEVADDLGDDGGDDLGDGDDDDDDRRETESVTEEDEPLLVQGEADDWPDYPVEDRPLASTGRLARTTGNRDDGSA